MATSVAVLFLGVLNLVVAQYQYDISDAGDLRIPEITSDLLDDLTHYLPCLDGNCHLSGISGTVDVPIVEVLPEHIDDPANHLSFCVEFLKKKTLFESQHPDLRALKPKLLSYLKEFLSSYTSQPGKRKDLLVDILRSIIHILQKLLVAVEKCPKRQIPTVSPIHPTEEIIAEEDVLYPGFVGSVRGIPGVHYPNYTEVPITSFSCSDKKYIPGFYADLETGCQVFHVCYEHRRESFLCPVGTIFNQPILACDYWYSSNCSLSEYYYDVNAKKDHVEIPKETDAIGEIITTIIEGEKPILPPIHVKSKETEAFKHELKNILKFLPIKAKIVEFPVVPVPPVKIVPVVKPLPVIKAKVIKAAVVPVVKAKVAAAVAVPVKAKVAAAVAVPVVKAKVAAAVPVIKAKVAAVPVVKAKVAVPVVKAKVVAASVPVFNVKTVAKVMPVVKIAAIKPKLAVVPLKVKAAVSSVPVIKTKVAISPLTKKALALGYMKLLKAKKLAFMG